MNGVIGRRAFDDLVDVALLYLSALAVSVAEPHPVSPEVLPASIGSGALLIGRIL